MFWLNLIPVWRADRVHSKLYSMWQDSAPAAAAPPKHENNINNNIRIIIWRMEFRIYCCPQSHKECEEPIKFRHKPTTKNGMHCTRNACIDHWPIEVHTKRDKKKNQRMADLFYGCLSKYKNIFCDSFLFFEVVGFLLMCTALACMLEARVCICLAIRGGGGGVGAVELVCSWFLEEVAHFEWMTYSTRNVRVYNLIFIWELI